MKKIVVASFISLMFLLVIEVKENSKQYSDLVMANIDALSRGEDISGKISCTGEGSIYCPINQKSEYKEVEIYQ